MMFGTLVKAVLECCIVRNGMPAVGDQASSDLEDVENSVASCRDAYRHIADNMDHTGSAYHSTPGFVLSEFVQNYH